jgi:hypothetical protein
MRRRPPPPVGPNGHISSSDASPQSRPRRPTPLSGIASRWSPPCRPTWLDEPGSTKSAAFPLSGAALRHDIRLSHAGCTPSAGQPEMGRRMARTRCAGRRTGEQRIGYERGGHAMNGFLDGDASSDQHLAQGPYGRGPCGTERSDSYCRTRCEPFAGRHRRPRRGAPALVGCN